LAKQAGITRLMCVLRGYLWVDVFNFVGIAAAPCAGQGLQGLQWAGEVHQLEGLLGSAFSGWIPLPGY
jgi:hypothetical protein